MPFPKRYPKAGTKTPLKIRLIEIKDALEELDGFISNDDLNSKATILKNNPKFRDIGLKIEQLYKQTKKALDDLGIEKDIEYPEFSVTDSEAKKVIRYVLQNCKDAVNACKAAGKFLYRGDVQAKKDDVAFVGTSRNDRRPTDSDSTISQEYDRILKSLGFSALRHNSIFCTSDLNHAEGFGQDYMIFPIDKHSSYTWVLYKDLTLRALQFYSKNKLNILHNTVLKWLEANRTQRNPAKNPSAAYNTSVGPRKVNKLHKKLSLAYNTGITSGKFYHTFGHYEDAEFVLETYKKAIKPFLALPEAKSLAFIMKLEPIQFLDVEQFIKKFEPKKVHLEQALENEYEVCVHGSYVALRVNVFRRYFQLALKMPIS